jgi:beta-lactamase regulating signal transducer with metallopeptidase domain
MGTDIVPYDPYHPHLGYTLAITCLAWTCVTLYNRFALRDRPHTRTSLYALAIGLPIYAEGAAYVINRVRPAPNTPIGYVLSHFHAYVIQRIPIDTFLSPAVGEIVLSILLMLLLGSVVRFVLSTRQLKRALAGAVPLSQTAYAHLGAQLAARDHAHALPAILVSDIDAPLAFTTGLLFPSIYITSTLLDLLTHDEMIAVLCHEWAHVLRRDNLWNWLVCLLRDVSWFLPGSHLAWRSMISSQDEACDALAATMTKQPLTLARALVKVASAWSDDTAPSLVAANSFARSSTAPRSRVEYMIRLSDDTAPLSRAYLAGAYALMVVFLVLGPLPALVGS